MSEQAFWLIEMQGPAWLMVRELGGGKHHGYVWTGDVQEALRFYSERQAELVMMAVRQDHRDLFPTCLIREPRPTEHMWVTQSLADLPEQPFNYRHPSKYGTDVPRRCYLEELTPEERAIRDLVDTVERLGAHPLLTATVIQLMKAGEDLADWVDIGLRDKAIAALSPGNDLGLLGENPAAGDTEVRNQAEGEAAKITERFPYEVNYKRKDGSRGGGGYETLEEAESFFDRLCNDVTVETATFREFYADVGAWELRASYEAHPDTERPSDESQATDQDRVEGDDGFELAASPDPDLLLENQPGVSSQASSGEAEIPEGFTKWGGGKCPLERGTEIELYIRGESIDYHLSHPLMNKPEYFADGCWEHIEGFDHIIAYRVIEASADAERIEVASEPRNTNEQEQKDEGLPVLDAGDIAEVLREGVPSDALLSTFADGKLYATFGGSTYLVIDSPKDADAFKETEPSAAYAHINEIDEPAGDAAVFARGPEREKELIAEAEHDKPNFIERVLGIVPKQKADA